VTHRRVWAEWVTAHSAQSVPPDALTQVMDATLVCGSIAERRVVVDTIADEGYCGVLLATYRGEVLASLVLDDDEAVTLLWPSED
jgi:hypothetical protein